MKLSLSPARHSWSSSGRSRCLPRSTRRALGPRRSAATPLDRSSPGAPAPPRPPRPLPGQAGLSLPPVPPSRARPRRRSVRRPPPVCSPMPRPPRERSWPSRAPGDSSRAPRAGSRARPWTARPHPLPPRTPREGSRARPSTARPHPLPPRLLRGSQLGLGPRGLIRCRLERLCHLGPRSLGLGHRGLAGSLSAGEALVELLVPPDLPGERLIHARRLPDRLLDGLGELGNAGLCEFARAFQLDPTGVRLRQLGGQALVVALERLQLLAQFRVCRHGRRGFGELFELGPSVLQNLVEGVERRLRVFLCPLLGSRRFTLREQGPGRRAGFERRQGAGRAGAEPKHAQAGERSQASA